MRILWGAACALLGGASCQRPLELPRRGEVVVVEVPAVNELVVAAEGKRAHLKLVGLHAFEPDDLRVEVGVVAEEALRFLREWVIGSLVTIYLDKTYDQPEGSYRGYAVKLERELAQRLLVTGRVMVDTRQPFDRQSTFLQTEAGARAGRRGMWARPEMIEMMRQLRLKWANQRPEVAGPGLKQIVENDSWLEWVPAQ